MLSNAHAMFYIIDESCFHGKEIKFIITIFAKLLEFLKDIKPGDILKLESIWLEYYDGLWRFQVKDQGKVLSQLVVFPGDGRDKKLCLDPKFNATEQDLKKVEEFKEKDWYKKIKKDTTSVSKVILHYLYA